MMLFIRMSNKQFFLISLLLCLLTASVGASMVSSKEKKIDRLISNICDQLNNNDNDGSDAIENAKWEQLCHSWFRLNHRDQQRQQQTEEEMIDNVENVRTFGLRRSSGGRSSGSRASSSSSRSSSSRTSSGSRTSGSRTSSITSYRSSRTGARISRPVGHLWSRTRHTFLPISSRYAHRTRTSNTRYTTPATGSITYYYCTSSTNETLEIQCSSETGDNQCCEDEISHQPFCCGGKISDDLIEEFSKAAQRLAKIFYTLTAVVLVLYIFRRR